MRVTPPGDEASAETELADAIARLNGDAPASTARLAFFEAKRAIFTELATKPAPPSVTLGHRYQQVLQSDVRYANGRYELVTSKTSRDTTGAYYTPRALAQEITRHSFDALIEQRLGIAAYSRSTATSAERAAVDDMLANIRIADLSCGGGDFLVAALEYAESYTSIADRLAGNLWAIDVDPIALKIAAAEIASKSPAATPHIILGNPLLKPEEPTTEEQRAALFAEGRIYASGMAVPLDALPPDGFDLILGNPPWEKIRFEERKFLKLLQGAPRAAELSDMLRADYGSVRERIAANPRMRHTPRGESNTYGLFPVLGVGMLAPGGVMSLILKSAIATSPVNAELFAWLRKTGGLRELHMHENTSRIFAIDSREKFCIAMFVRAPAAPLRVSFGTTMVAAFDALPTVSVSDNELRAIHPATGTLPNVMSTEDFAGLQQIAARLPRFGDRHDARFGRIVHLTTHARSISRSAEPGSLPILEGKFIGPYTVRAATFEGVPDERRYAAKAQARRTAFAERLAAPAEPRFFIGADRWRELSRGFDRPYMLGWRSLTSATNARTTIAAIAPFGPAIQSVQFLQVADDRELIYLLGLFNSMAFDHLVRLMIPGIDLTQAVIRQVPVPSDATLSGKLRFLGIDDTLEEHIVSRVRRLLRHEAEAVALVDGPGAARQALDEQEHARLTAEIDELFFLAYGMDAAKIERVRAGFRGATIPPR